MQRKRGEVEVRTDLEKDLYFLGSMSPARSCNVAKRPVNLNTQRCGCVFGSDVNARH